jgi:hypothetical protein
MAVAARSSDQGQHTRAEDWKPIDRMLRRPSTAITPPDTASANPRRGAPWATP